MGYGWQRAPAPLFFLKEEERKKERKPCVAPLLNLNIYIVTIH
jgi:hypothetical protein